jgi:hypothetical protein
MSTLETCALSYSSNSTLRHPIGKTCSLGNIPDFFVDVSDVSDVQTALKFAREKKVPVVVKNSGHDHKGRSSGAGTLAIWVNNYKPALKLHRKFVPAGCQEDVGDAVTMGAGTDFKMLYSFAENNNVTVVGGTNPTVRYVLLAIYYLYLLMIMFAVLPEGSHLGVDMVLFPTHLDWVPTMPYNSKPCSQMERTLLPIAAKTRTCSSLCEAVAGMPLVSL